MTPAKPNILLICVDHWPGALLGCSGHSSVLTPTMDQLAAIGTNYLSAYSACPVCIPARRTLMTGLSPRSHGDRTFSERLPMPDVPTLAQCFRNAGYQAFAVGKLHAYPPRSRMGFDDVTSNEEGRHPPGSSDDWQIHLAENGYFGEEYAAGGINNDYAIAPWHLPERLHPTNWTAREMCRTIRRLDPTKPAFLYASFTAPHPPMWTLRDFQALYRNVPIDDPVCGDWVEEWPARPFKCRAYFSGHTMRTASPSHIREVRRAFYSMITHVDRQIRVILGTLRERSLLENTAIVFTSDHGDMLGDHGLWAKSFFYEPSAQVPLIIVPPPQSRQPRGLTDNRLVELRDIMPTLLDTAGIRPPPHCEGISLLTDQRRTFLYGEHGEGTKASRMIRRGSLKLIYYAEGNRFELFDLEADPRECANQAANPAYETLRKELQDLLAAELYGEDRQWLKGSQWVGLPKADHAGDPLNFSFGGQRGIRFP